MEFHVSWAAGAYLLIVLKPLRCDLGYGVILLSLAGRNASQLERVSFSHGPQELSVHILLQTCRLLYNTKQG